MIDRYYLVFVLVYSFGLFVSCSMFSVVGFSFCFLLLGSVWGSIRRSSSSIASCVIVVVFAVFTVMLCSSVSVAVITISLLLLSSSVGLGSSSSTSSNALTVVSMVSGGSSNVKSVVSMVSGGVFGDIVVMSLGSFFSFEGSSLDHSLSLSLSSSLSLSVVPVLSFSLCCGYCMSMADFASFSFDAASIAFFFSLFANLIQSVVSTLHVDRFRAVLASSVQVCPHSSSVWTMFKFSRYSCNFSFCSRFFFWFG